MLSNVIADSTKSTVGQIGLSTRNILNPNVIGQNATIALANAAEIIALLFADNGNNVNTILKNIGNGQKSNSGAGS